ncbi:PTS sugar transporter subunit IIA [Enterococcus camelliae]|uniref:PTS sugar transporter subunit IIA n=1 Tax=Enterococcus camelliae TaxID=453959 RepID=A0ABW5TJ11_9ENTE
MRIQDLLKRSNLIKLSKTYESKEFLFIDFINHFFDRYDESKKARFVLTLLNREKMGSTYIGKQMALAHMISSEIEKSQIYICFLKEPFLEWDDEENFVKIVIVYCLRNNVDEFETIKKFSKRLAYETIKNEISSVEYDNLYDYFINKN